MSSWYSTMFPRSMVRVVASGLLRRRKITSRDKGNHYHDDISCFLNHFSSMPPSERISIVRTNCYRSPVVLRKTKARECLVVQGRRIPQNRDRYRLSQLYPFDSIRSVM